MGIWRNSGKWGPGSGRKVDSTDNVASTDVRDAGADVQSVGDGGSSMSIGEGLQLRGCDISVLVLIVDEFLVVA